MLAVQGEHLKGFKFRGGRAMCVCVFKPLKSPISTHSLSCKQSLYDCLEMDVSFCSKPATLVFPVRDVTDFVLQE